MSKESGRSTANSQNVPPLDVTAAYFHVLLLPYRTNNYYLVITQNSSSITVVPNRFLFFLRRIRLEIRKTNCNSILPVIEFKTRIQTELAIFQLFDVLKSMFFSKYVFLKDVYWQRWIFYIKYDVRQVCVFPSLLLHLYSEYIFSEALERKRSIYCWLTKL